jgi:hypothetical protein
MPVAHISFVGANSFGHDEDGTVARVFSWWRFPLM